MGLFTWLNDLGTKEEMKDDLRNKIRLSNYLTFTFASIIFVYSIIAFTAVPSMFKYCLLGFGLLSTNLLIAYFGWHKLTRLGLTFLAPFIMGMLHATVMQEADSPVDEIYAFQAVVCMIPVAIFDIKKYRYWVLPFLFSFSMIFFINELNQVFDESFDNTIFLEGWIRFAALGGAIAIGAFIIIFLKHLNLNQYKKSNQLRAKLEEENKTAIEKEKELTQTLSDLELAQKEEAKRNWKTSGLAEIGNLIRIENDLDRLTDQIIAYIVKYMGANQGALFLIDDEIHDNTVELYLKSAYAYKRKKKLDERFKAGEGLIGQCYLERDFLYLTDVPDHFVNIKSGLGDANPRSILISPMIVNEQVYGVFEVASFKEIEPYQIEFMMELGENIAMTLNNFKVNAQTKKLLEETQEQSEQLRSQEEEMRQNMEELQATQEEQERRYKEMDEKNEALEMEKKILQARLATYEDQDPKV